VSVSDVVGDDSDFVWLVFSVVKTLVDTFGEEDEYLVVVSIGVTFVIFVENSTGIVSVVEEDL
jgi:hypothetical protein